MFNIEIVGPKLGQSGYCLSILHSLPEWFGIESALVDYSKQIESLPTWLALDNETTAGFISLKEHNPYSAEIYVMGVLPVYHRQGIGKKMFETVLEWLRKHNYEYLQVKTLGPSRSDKNYAYTRLFYESMGFRPLEELTQIWDENNPCLIMIMKL